MWAVEGCGKSQVVGGGSVLTLLLGHYLGGTALWDDLLIKREGT